MAARRLDAITLRSRGTSAALIACTVARSGSTASCFRVVTGTTAGAGGVTASSTAAASSATDWKRAPGAGMSSRRRISRRRGSTRAAKSAGELRRARGEDPFAHHRHRAPAEGALPGQHLEEDDPQRVEVRPRVDRLAERLLRRHVVGRPEHRADPRELRRGPAARRLGGRVDLGDPEVEDLHEVRVAVVLDEHHVLGLEVAVDDARGVRGAERRGDAPQDVNRAFERQRAVLQLVAQAAPRDVLEDEEERAVAQAAEVGGRGDVGVLDVPGGDGLALEAREDLGALREVGVEHLERDALAHVHVLREVHRAHAALAQQVLDAVTLRDHRAFGQETRVGRHAWPPDLEGSSQEHAAAVRADRGRRLHAPRRGEQPAASRRPRRARRPR